MPRTFRSDNNAGICPEAMQAIIEANNGSHLLGYGDDAATARAIDKFRDIFGPDTGVHFVATGTAANTLAIASLTEPWERILCHAHSHLNDDESTAPERITHCRVTPIETERARSKLTTADLERYGRNTRGDVHQPAPGVLTISNSTELGEVYTPDQMKEICQTAHGFGYRVHVDGARFANAVAGQGCDPRALTNDAGVDAMSFGGTKNGLAFGEAVLFFAQGDGLAFERAQRTFEFHRKGTGHLLSKHRFVSAPFAATLKDDVWLKHAQHANTAAAHLSSGLADLGIQLGYQTDANGVFAILPAALGAGLQARGHEFYMFGDASWNLARLMCSFDTQAEDVDGFLKDAADLA